MKNFTTYTTILLTSLLMIVLQTSVFGQDLNLSGYWKYNKSKSNLSSYPEYIFPDRLNVIITHDTISVQGIFNNNSQTAPASKYSLSGTIVKKLYSDGSVRQTSYKMGMDNRSIVKHSVLLKANEIIRTTDEVWTISTDKQNLSIYLTETETGSNGYKVEGFFER